MPLSAYRAVQHSLVLLTVVASNRLHHLTPREALLPLMPQPPAQDAACGVKIDNGASRTIRVAFGFYGLPRYACTSDNIARLPSRVHVTALKAPL